MSTGVQTEEIKNKDIPKGYVEEEGKLYKMPYRMIKRITFNNVDQKDLKDLAHSARLQYRLLNLDAIIKAKVNFVKKQIQIIYNNPEAENNKAKISREELIKFLEKEGIHINEKDIVEEDFDYYKSFYSTTFFPKTIRNAVPYGWSKSEYEKIKKSIEAKAKKGK
ncbi:MAG: hypothetical protein ACP5RI_03335 [Candidatus Micrarchaeia archaeon]